MTNISIVTPCYNSARTIRQTLDSVLNQTKPPYEYIVKDGGSTDSTMQILEEYREAFRQKNITYRILSSPDGGIYDAMNQGIATATGDVIGIINSDDWLEPVAVQRVSETYEETPFDLFYADLRIWREEGNGELTQKLVKKARYRKHPVPAESEGVFRNLPQIYGT